MSIKIGFKVAGGAGGGSGETNTASNIGTAGVGVFDSKSGSDLRFKKINAGSADVIVEDDSGNNEIDISHRKTGFIFINGIAAIGDGVAYFDIPDTFDNHNLVFVRIKARTAGTTGTGTYQIHHVEHGVDMLSTALTIDSTETTSATAATAAVIDTSNDHVNSGDTLRIDCDGIHTTPLEDAVLELKFEPI